MTTPARQNYARLLAYMAAHNCNLTDAARACGVSPSTARAWRKRYGGQVEIPDIVPTNESLPRVKSGAIRGTTKATEEVIEKVCSYLTDGVSRRSAATLANVAYAALTYWYSEGQKEPDGPYGWIALRIDAAEAAAEQSWLAELVRLAKSNKPGWKAFAWLLERRHRHTWGPVAEHRMTNAKGDGPVEIMSVLEQTIPKLTPEQLEALAGGTVH